MNYSLSSEEQTRLIQSIRTALTIPFIDGVEDYVWEAVFHYVKKLPMKDPHSDLRQKLLFDAVDTKMAIGWSLKSHQGICPVGSTFEVVIQRADIFDKRESLGFPNLVRDSDPEELGNAVMTHWLSKFRSDSKIQGVSHPRIAILLKSKNHRRYALLDQDLSIHENTELMWAWTNEDKRGLQGKNKYTGKLIYRWYPNQKQFFEAFTLSPECFHFEVDASRMEPSIFLEKLFTFLK